MSNNPQKQIYKVDVTWQVEGTVEVKAWSEDDACNKAGEMIDNGIIPHGIRNVPDSADVNEVFIKEGPMDREQAKPVAEKEPRREGADTVDRTVNKGLKEIYELVYPSESKVKELILEPKDRARI